MQTPKLPLFSEKMLPAIIQNLETASLPSLFILLESAHTMAKHFNNRKMFHT